MKLSNFIRGRENNFNLIRVVAALGVLISHSFALTSGNPNAEPFRAMIGMSLGSIAVDIFFITSGFLVTASLLTRQNIIDFVWARTLRIYPALLVMLLLTVFGLGVFFTSLPVSSYLQHSGTYLYLLKCSTLFTGISFGLPGVFSGNPYRSMVNGSLWTMPYEVRMYAILAVIWVVLRIDAANRLRLFQSVIVISALGAGILVCTSHFYFPSRNSFAGLFYMFFSGAAFFVLKEKITLSRPIFWLLVITLLVSAMGNKNVFFVAYELAIAYILFYVAYIPAGAARKYNRAGDYSYGIYIYAFPVQQSIAALVPGISVLSMFLYSAAVSFLLAVISWHLVERRALDLKDRYISGTKKLLASI